MSVTRVYRYVCCEMKCFFKAFINHFPKVHRSVVHKITIDLLYFWDVYDVNLWEENFGRSTACSCRTNVFQGKNHFKGKERLQHRWNLWNLWNFPEQWWLFLETRNILLRNKNYVMHKLAIFNAVLLLLHLLLTQ